MSNICENNISVTCSDAEWEEISNGLKNENISWPPSYEEGRQAWNKSISFLTKWAPTPMGDGDMSKISKMYPTMLFKYSYEIIEGDFSRGTCYYINGKDYGNKKSAIKGGDNSIKNYFERLALQTNEHGEGINHIVELMPQGIVAADGENRFGECNIYDFENIVQISCGDWHTVVLDKNGKAYSCGSNYNGQCDIPKSDKKIVKVSCGRYHTAFLYDDGTVQYSGSIKNADTDLAGWNNIKDLCSVYDGIAAIDDNNQVFIWGNTACSDETCKMFFTAFENDDIDAVIFSYEDALSNENV